MTSRRTSKEPSDSGLHRSSARPQGESVALVPTRGGVQALVPKEAGQPKLTGRSSRAAAGIGAVASSLRYSLTTGPLRALKSLFIVNQKQGFDCPGCAWPDPDHRAMAEFCENGARAVADEATDRRVDPAFFARYGIEAIGEHSDRWINAQGRLTHPMYLAPGEQHYTTISWDEAFDKIAAHLRQLDSPDEAVFYTSGRTSNEAAFLYQLFVRQYGTNNLPDCSNMCHESSGVALSQAIGIGKGTVQLADFEKADLIWVFGQNPGTNHPRMLSTLREARLRGATIISVNPIREQALVRFAHPQKLGDLFSNGVEVAHEHIQVKINGDHGFILGLEKAVFELEAEAEGQVLDHEFIADHTSGFSELRKAIEALDWRELEQAAGVDRATMQRLGRLYARSNRSIACWAMGLTQHHNGVAVIQELVNLMLLRGNLGRAGAGLCPVRGHSNVQGDRTMGIWEHRPPWIDRLEAHYDFVAPQVSGMDVVAAIHAMDEGRAKVFFGLGGNFLSAAPDTEKTARGLQRCRLTVHVSTKLNRAHLVPGEEALILPCMARTELDHNAAGERQFVTVENSMGVVHASRGRLAPLSDHLLPEVAIVAGLARATLGNDHSVDWEGLAGDYARVREDIAAVVPGFEAYNERVAQPGGFLLENPAAVRRWQTSDGRAQFHVHRLQTIETEAGELLMMTLRAHDQYNTTIYENNDRYRGVHGFRRVVFMAKADMGARGLVEGDEVNISSRHRGVIRQAEGFKVVELDLPAGACATYFPEANVLVPIDSIAERSRTPTSKSVVVSVEAAARG